MGFVNRRAELALLRRTFDASPALFVLYGRRRVGKTALLRRVCKDRRHLFFTADLGTTRDHLASFASALARDLDEPEWQGAAFASWQDALKVCIQRALEQPLVLVLDEFQHLVTADPSLASILQRLWDQDIQSSKLSIVLCGSYVSFMEREVLGVRNPLYGRRTGQLRLQPFSAVDGADFLTGWPAEQQMQGVGVFGGIPAYLQLLGTEESLSTNIQRTVLEPGAPLFEEPRFLMMEEVREPRNYFSVCRALANGRRSPNEIAQAAGLPPNAMSHYLTTLQGLSLVERRVPATVRNPDRTRRALYRIRDPLVRFWFRFVLPNRTALEAGDSHLVWRRKIEPHLAQFVATGFEDACVEYLRQQNRHGALPAEYDRVGPWWHGREEVDALAVADDGPILLAECKWSTKPVGVNVLDRLLQKVTAVQRDLEKPATKVDLALFSRVGFTTDLKRRAEQENVLLVTVDQVLERSNQA